MNIVLCIYNPTNPNSMEIIFSRVTTTGRSFIVFPLLHFIPRTELYKLKIMLIMIMIELKYMLYIYFS